MSEDPPAQSSPRPAEELMNNELEPEDRSAIERVIQRLEAAWNAGDGPAFGAAMTPDADFVTIRAEHYRGREAIAAGHAGIFRTIYSGSTNRYTIETARLLAPGIALVHVQATLDVPTGPLAGRHSALFSAVLMRTAGVWLITAFHNTLASSKGASP
jgi:uncharacterized protein (TIGR02246 family)